MKCWCETRIHRHHKNHIQFGQNLLQHCGGSCRIEATPARLPSPDPPDRAMQVVIAFAVDEE
jgi:hypothetical protein